MSPTLVNFLCLSLYIHMWQSRVEIEGYSIVYFDHIAAFETRCITELLLRAGLIRAS